MRFKLLEGFSFALKKKKKKEKQSETFFRKVNQSIYVIDVLRKISSFFSFKKKVLISLVRKLFYVTIPSKTIYRGGGGAIEGNTEREREK